jgi:hypothetical protein
VRPMRRCNPLLVLFNKIKIVIWVRPDIKGFENVQ